MLETENHVTVQYKNTPTALKIVLRGFLKWSEQQGNKQTRSWATMALEEGRHLKKTVPRGCFGMGRGVPLFWTSPGYLEHFEKGEEMQFKAYRKGISH